MAKQADNNIIVHKIEIRQINRSTVEIGPWRSAIKKAENVTFPKRRDLYDLYGEALLDSHLRSVIDKRIRAVSNTPIIFVNEDGTENEDITKWIQAPWFSRLIKDVMWSLFWGHSLFEFSLFQLDGVKYNLIPRKNVVPELGVVLLKETDSSGGIEYRLPPYDKTCIEVSAMDPNGLLMNACPWVIYKRNGFGDFAQYLELYGIPLREGTYDGHDENARIKLVETLSDMGSAQVVVLPDGTSVKIHEVQGKGDTGTLHKTFIDICNAELSKLILGNTLTTEQGDKGARSLGEVHQDVEDSVNSDDRVYVDEFLNFTLKNLMQLNGIVKEGGSFLFKESERLSMSEEIKIDESLSRLNVPLSDDYFYDKYKRPKPENYDELKEEMKQLQNQKSPDNTIQAALDSERKRKGLRFF